MINTIKRLLEPIQNKIILMITKAVINTVNDSEKIQLVQVDLGNGEVIDAVERIQNFGFTSHPEAGAQAIVLCVAGQREHPIVIVADDGELRPTLSKGETAQYNASMIVHLKDGTIELKKKPGVLTALDGVVTGQCLCAFTGTPHPDKSTIVKAQKL